MNNQHYATRINFKSTIQNTSKILKSIFALGLAITLVACGGSEDSHPVPEMPSGLKVYVPEGVIQNKLPTDGTLRAYISIDGNDRIPMTIVDGEARARLEEIDFGEHIFRIEFEFDSDDFGQGIDVAQVSRTIDVGSNTGLTFQQGDYDTSFDDDNDNRTNLEELTANLNPRIPHIPAGESITVTSQIPTDLLSNDLPTDGTLRATLSVNGGEEQAMTLSGDNVSLALEDMTIAQHIFKIRFYFDDATSGDSVQVSEIDQLASIQTTNDSPDFNTAIPNFSLDSDGDGTSNIDEVIAGTPALPTPTPTPVISITPTPAPDNAPPVLSNIVIVDTNSQPAIVGDTLRVTFSYSDAESDSEGSHLIQWLRNGSEISGATSTEYILIADDSDSVITVEVTPIALEGTSPGSATLSNNAVAITNSAPTVSNVSITDENAGTIQIGDQLIGSYVYTDLNADPEGATGYRWVRNGTIEVGVQTTYIVTNNDYGQTITFEVTPRAQTGVPIGETVSSKGVLLSDNAAPEAIDVSISTNGEYIVGVELSGQYTYQDAENDPQDTNATSFRWLRNGTAIEDATEMTYTTVAEDSGQEIQFEVTPVATQANRNGSAQTSPAVTINNSLPYIEPNSISIIDGNGSPLGVGDELSVNYTFVDIDGDLEGATTYQWLAGGVVIDGATNSTYVIQGSQSSTPISVQITPVASSGDTSPGITITSSSVTAGNSAPSATIEISAAADYLVGDTLISSYSVTDLEDDPLGAHNFQWFRNGSAIVSATSDTYTTTIADSGQNISVRIIPVATSGSEEGAAATSTEVSINAVPTVSDITITDDNGGNVVVGDVLSVDFILEDSEDAPDTLSASIQWMRDGIAIESATNNTYTLTAEDNGNTIEGFEISVEVTPIASAGSSPGVAVETGDSENVNVINSAPTLTAVGINDANGNTVQIGDVLTGTYDYFDADIDAIDESATSFEWRNGNTVLSTQQSYTVTESDSGATLTFEVTPRAKTGVISGAASSTIVSVETNTAPIVSNVRITDGTGNELFSAPVGTTITGSYDFTDPEDGEGNSTYVWLRNGSPISGANSISYTLAPADKGENIQFRVTAIADGGVTRGNTELSSNGLIAYQQYTLTYNAGSNGSVSGSTAQTVIENGSGTTVTAVANTGYHFTSWNDQVTTASRTDSNITANLNVTAQFAINVYSVSVTSSTGGTISQSTSPINVNHGSTVSFLVNPDANYSASVSGDCGGSISNGQYTSPTITEACSIDIDFILDAHTLSVTYNNSQGSVTPASQAVEHGSSANFTITPNVGYAIDSTSSQCGGNLSGSTFSISSITDDCNVTVSFVETFVASTSTSAGGSISPTSQSVVDGENATFTVTPNTDFEVLDISGCGGDINDLSGNQYTTGAVTANCSVSVSFIELHSVSGSAGSGGSISIADNSVRNGESTTFTVIPNSGFETLSVSASGCTVTNTSGTNYSTGSITSDCSITALFIELHTVSATAGTGGSITPSSRTVRDGEVTTFTVSANSGYEIQNVSGCGSTIDNLSGSTFTTVSITADCTVSATFQLDADQLTPTLSINYQAMKTFEFSWSDVAIETEYRLLESANGLEEHVQIATISSDTTQYNLEVLLPSRIEASYILQACVNNDCFSSDSVMVTSGTNGIDEAIGYLKPTNTRAGFRFGTSVSLSDDGTTLAVGAVYEDSTDSSGTTAGDRSGGVYIYTKQNNSWVLEQLIKSPVLVLNDFFGTSVSLSSDGNTLAVGAYGNDSGNSGIGASISGNTEADSGAAFVYDRTNGSWSLTTTIKAPTPTAGDRFGSTVKLSGDSQSLVVTAPRRHDATEGWTDSGAVYHYMDNSGWSYIRTIAPDTLNNNAWYGTSVDLSDDGTILVVGAPREDSDAVGVDGTSSATTADSSGAAFIYFLHPGYYTLEAYLKSSNSETNDYFGQSVAISSDGTKVVVGASVEDGGTTGVNGSTASNSVGGSGAVYLFEESNDQWSETTYFKASTVLGADHFGEFVTISGDGSRIVVVAKYENNIANGLNGNETADRTSYLIGAAYQFTFDDGGWYQEAYIKPLDSEIQDEFGRSIDISADGTTLVIGTPGDDGSGNGVNGDPSNNDALSSGAVYVY